MEKKITAALAAILAFGSSSVLASEPNENEAYHQEAIDQVSDDQRNELYPFNTFDSQDEETDSDVSEESAFCEEEFEQEESEHPEEHHLAEEEESDEPIPDSQIFEDPNYTKQYAQSIAEDRSEENAGQTVSENSQDTQTETVLQNSSILKTDETAFRSGNQTHARGLHTKDEIVSYYQNSLKQYKKENTVAALSFREQQTNHQDQLTKESKDQLLAILNFYRWQDGLAPLREVASYSALAQKGAEYLSQRQLSLQHQVLESDKKDPSLKQTDQALSRSNLAKSLNPNASTMLKFFYNDEDEANQLVAGHRRSLLDEKASGIGFGFSQDAAGYAYLAVYMGDENKQIPSKVVSFPSSGSFPIERLVTGAGKIVPWSVSLGNEFKQNGRLHVKHPEKIQIRITDDTGRGYLLKSNHYVKDTPPGLNQDWFTYSKVPAGNGDAIIFNPYSLSKGNYLNLLDRSFTVSITGLTDANGQNASYTFSPSFFSLSQALIESKNKDQSDYVTKLIASLNQNPGYQDLGAYANAVSAYNALSDQAKHRVSNLSLLQQGIEKVKAEKENYEKSSRLNQLIQALPEANAIKLSDAAQVYSLITAYQNLPHAQKKYITSGQKLAEALGRLQQLKTAQEKQKKDQQAASETEKILLSLPDVLRLSGESAFLKASIAYQGLTEDQRGLISYQALERYRKVENQLNQLRLEQELLKKSSLKKEADKTEERQETGNKSVPVQLNKQDFVEREKSLQTEDLKPEDTEQKVIESVNVSVKTENSGEEKENHPEEIAVDTKGNLIKKDEAIDVSVSSEFQETSPIQYEEAAEELTSEQESESSLHDNESYHFLNQAEEAEVTEKINEEQTDSSNQVDIHHSSQEAFEVSDSALVEERKEPINASEDGLQSVAPKSSENQTSPTGSAENKKLAEIEAYLDSVDADNSEDQHERFYADTEKTDSSESPEQLQNQYSDKLYQLNIQKEEEDLNAAVSFQEFAETVLPSASEEIKAAVLSSYDSLNEDQRELLPIGLKESVESLSERTSSPQTGNIAANPFPLAAGITAALGFGIFANKKRKAF